MIGGKTRNLVAAGLMTAGLCLSGSAQADSAPDKVALAIGNGAYTSLAPIPGCPTSAEVVANRLRQNGFDVMLRSDLSNGAMSAALGEFRQRAASAKSAVIYVCGYALAHEDRVFLLPVTANIARPSDALSQGFPVRSVLNAASAGGTGLVLLDGFDMPGNASGLPGAASRQTLQSKQFVAVSETRQPVSTVSSMARALVHALADPAQEVGAMLGTIRTSLSGSGTDFEFAGSGNAALASAPDHTEQPASPAPASASVPDETHYSDADRRNIQSALTRLGYYAGKTDGVFGADTRAAIRRYQHELGMDMNGHLTQPQAAKLAGPSTAN